MFHYASLLLVWYSLLRTHLQQISKKWACLIRQKQRHFPREITEFSEVKAAFVNSLVQAKYQTLGMSYLANLCFVSQRQFTLPEGSQVDIKYWLAI